MTASELVRAMLYGAMTLASLVAAGFFAKYWRQSRDRLFVMFSAAFVLLALNWIAMAFVPATAESRELYYLFRLAAFVVIIVAIVDKNRRPGRS